MKSTTTRRPYFLEENNGLASISDIEHGFSSSPSPSPSTEDKHRAGSHRISRPLYSPRKASLGNVFSFSSPRSLRSVHGRFEEEEQPYFLDACFLCKKPLGQNRDIFMYRGDTPFCSEECRTEQIDIDESKQKTKHLSSSMKALRKKEQIETVTTQTQVVNVELEAKARSEIIAKWSFAKVVNVELEAKARSEIIAKWSFAKVISV